MINMIRMVRMMRMMRTMVHLGLKFTNDACFQIIDHTLQRINERTKV
jgi:hypothetical protein